MKKIFTLLLLSSIVFYSCKRNQKNYAGVDQSNSDLPKSEVLASNYAIPHDGTIVALNSRGANKLSGEQLFVANCSACHQKTGKGIAKVFPPLDASPYVVSQNVERMAAIMIYGLQGPIKVLGQEYNSVMAPLGATLDDQALADIATYVRSAWSNKAPAVDVEVISKTRAKYGSRGLFKIEELGKEE